MSYSSGGAAVQLAPEPAAETPETPGMGRRITVAFMLLALVLGFASAWESRHDMYSDGISYLDVADAFRHGDWKAAVNPYWSPLYPALIGGALAIVNPSVYWEFTTVHMVNLFVFALAFGSFHFFLSEVLRNHRETASSGSLPESSWRMLGYTLFLWAALKLITVAVVSPDMLVSATVYLAAGLLLRIKTGSTGWWEYAALGATLGVGYLAKAPMLPISLVFLVLSLFAGRELRKSVPRTLLAAAMLLVVASPFVTALSVSRGHFTMGDSWRLNLAWYVNDVPRYHWQGDIAGLGTPEHSTRKIFSSPAVFEFNGPVEGTYPIWLDPSWWFDGIQPHFEPRRIFRQTVVDGLEYYDVFFHLQLPLVVVAFTLLLAGGRGLKGLRDIAGHWVMLVPAIAALCLYAPVHVEQRMIGAWVVLLWVGIYSGIRLFDKEVRRLASYYLSVMVLFMLIIIGLSSAGELASHSPRELLTLTSTHPQWQVSEGLLQAGLQRGDKVAWIRPHPFNASRNYWWARLAGVRIIAEIPVGQESVFWNSDPVRRDEVFDALRIAGAKALIVTNIPVGASKEGWSRVGQSDYYIRLLRS